MEVITRDIERALDAGLYYLALLCTLSLPDICAALESHDGRATKRSYTGWCTKWFTEYPEITSDDLYYLRCGVVHQGRLGHPDSQYSRILFTLPNASQNVCHRNIMRDALNLDVTLFCHDMVGAVSRWYAAKQNDSNVKSNLPRLVQYREQGLGPYLVGIPLIT
jgi:hypothetical protein